MLTHRAIVATLGPATDRPGVLDAMLAAGLDVARINFSHGEGGDHRQRITAFREASTRAHRWTAVLADLPGPKLRALIDSTCELSEGQEIRFATAPDTSADIRPTEPEFLAHVQPHQRILLDDGRLCLRAVRHDGPCLVACVEVGGTLERKKGINLPDTDLKIPALTERDRAALALAAAAHVDWLALSFVCGPEAASELRQAAADLGLHVPVLAKIERPQAVQSAAAIVAAFDGIMVARGDLGVEIPLEQVPPIQKRLIATARAAGTTSHHGDRDARLDAEPVPGQRAEWASDVANAIYDGTDAVMLSGETAVGAHPVEAVSYMNRIARAAEADLRKDGWDVVVPQGTIDDHLTHLTRTLAQDIGADAIVVPTLTGRTARLVARHRPRATVVAAAPTEEVLHRLALVWGLRAVPLPTRLSSGEDRLETAVRAAFASGVISTGQVVVVLAGHAVEGGERLPTLRVVRVGEGGRSREP